ncbi:MAG: amino acid permease [Gammaproteobacteria bacterium]|nr:amino acid permease [Gammaproteobacteria bacterium]
MALRQRLLRKKPIEAPQETSLHRCLGALDLVLLGIGAIIGTGIFVLTGIAAANQAGPALVLSFVVAGVACGAAALAYAELAASLGGCGSAYGYSYTAFGEIFAWLIGWILVLEYGVAVAAVATGWSGYFGNALHVVGLTLPEALTRPPAAGGIADVPALGIVLTLMALVAYGVRESARVNAAMVFVKLATIAVFIGVAAFHVEPANWTPFMPYGWIHVDADGSKTGILAGASIVFFAYIGFDAVSTAAEEARDPQRDLPIGIIGSLIVCTVLYIVVSALLTGIVPYTRLDVSSPVAFALHEIGVDWASGLVAGGAIAGITTVMLVLYYGLTRIVFAMARDGLMPPALARVNPRTRTPLRVIVLCGIVIAALAGFVPLNELAELVNFGTLSAFVMVCVGVVVMRRNHPDLPRPFRTPLYPLVPVVGALSCAALMVFLPQATWSRFALWLGAGLAFYALYSCRHSRLAAP